MKTTHFENLYLVVFICLSQFYPPSYSLILSYICEILENVLIQYFVKYLKH